MTVEYAKTRVAFGQTIGRYQGVKHKCADMYIKIELARAHALHGIAMIGSNGAELRQAAAAARVASLDAAKSFHKSQRGSDGQAKRLGLLDRAIVRQAVYRKLLKETMVKVGLSKAGWGVAATACKADARQPLRGIPAWVRRNMGRARGSVNDRRAAGFSWQIKLSNRVRYARETLSTSGQSFAVNLARRKFFSMMNHAIRAQKAKEAGLKQ